MTILPATAALIVRAFAAVVSANVIVPDAVAVPAVAVYVYVPASHA